MLANELLLDGFDRVNQLVSRVLDDITEADLVRRVDPDANTIAWLVWHLTRVQDDHIADVAGSEQVWLRDGWCDRFDLPFDAHAIGYGHTSAEVAQVVASPELLRGYHQATHARTAEYVAGLTEEEYPRVVDTRWDPPVTLAVRLVSVLSDDLQHVGQAAYLRGVLSRLG